MSPIPATPPAATTIDTLIEARYGIDISRLAPRSRDRLRRSPLEEEALEREVISEACIRESMVLRHPEDLAALTALAQLLPQARLRVWSAGCSTGEEVYSLAALLGERAEVLGTDLDPLSLARARRGRYRSWSLRGLSAPPPWLRPLAQDRYEVDPALRPRVRFERGNILDAVGARDLDVIVCRNVFIYFSADAAARARRLFAERLGPGGLLLLGPQDPRPLPGEGWRRAEPRAPLYQRADVAPLNRDPDPHPLRFPAPLRPPPLRPTPPAAPAPPRLDPAALLREARAAMLSERWSAAAHILSTLLEHQPGCAPGQALMALVELDRQRPRQALAAARRLGFLRPGDDQAQLLIARARLACGDTPGARRAYAEALRLRGERRPDLPLEPSELRSAIDDRCRGVPLNG